MTTMSLDSLQDIQLRRAMCADAIEFVRADGREPEAKVVALLADYDAQLALMTGRTQLNASTMVDDGVRDTVRDSLGRARAPHGQGGAHSATDKQVNFLRKLIDTKDHGSVRIPADVAGIGKVACSALIDQLIDRPAKGGARTSTSGTSFRAASEKQVGFLTKLLGEKDHDFNTAEIEANLAAGRVSGTEASGLIDSLLKMASKRVIRTAVDELVDGFYLFEGTYYLVQHAVHGSGHQYAKQWFPAQGEAEGYFDVARGMVRKLRAEHQLSTEQAEQFGQVYGRCGKCGRTLTDKNVSMKLGIGPECRKQA